MPALHAGRYDTSKVGLPNTGKQCATHIRLLPRPRANEDMKICTAPNCGLIFETHQDREKREKYHCGNPPSGYNNIGEPGKIDRQTPYGFGIPKTDMGYFNENILFDPNTQSWKCLHCNYTRAKHRRYHVFGHAAATHGYTSRTPNERRGIQIHAKYPDEPETNPPQEIKPYMAAEIDNRRIQIRINGNNDIPWECGYCRKQYAEERGITTHIGKCTTKLKQGNLYAPYCPETCYNLANLNRHMMNKSCANKQQGT